MRIDEPVMWFLLLIFSGLFLFEFAYLKFAERNGIVDRPNERSSHSFVTIRGGGILFPFSWIIFELLNNFPHPIVTSGLVLVSVLSFVDDIRPLQARVRAPFQLLSLALLFWSFPFVHDLSEIEIVFGMIAAFAVLNAVNFMDGINGITAMYGMAVLLLFTLSFEQYQRVSPANPMVFLFSGLMVFGYFNFRTKAKCFAGDVGSISLSYLLLFFLLQALSAGQAQVSAIWNLDWYYVLFLLVYGADSLTTIVHRLILRENIVKPHRKHLYQLLTNEIGFGHLKVTFSYASVQLLIGLLIIKSDSKIRIAIITLVAILLIFIVLRVAIYKRLGAKGQL